MIRVDHEEKKVVYEDKEGVKHEEKYDALLSTSPIDILIRETQLTDPLNIKYNKVCILPKYHHLLSFSLQVFVVGVGLHKPMTPFLEPITWLYFPDKNVPFFRVTILSRYGEVREEREREREREGDDSFSSDDSRWRQILVCYV